MTLRIRPATPADAERVVDIWAPGWRDGHLGHVPEALLAHRTREAFVPRVAAAIPRTRVAEVDGVIAGFTMTAGDEVDQVYVDPAFRGTGVAAALLADAADAVRAAGHPVPWLAVASGNARARHFYEREGWTDAGEFAYAAEIGADASVPVSCHRMELRPARA
ncbi:GNAT family N-acetyltransferase [Protaetiibacter intestinalis]|uniref:GNAT family N-acetyltransferase n=1 Tax=Protaetiibacter intestinalis TaxID=2419774 RepID=UPI001D058740|nr:GNAT family N-acetyltransferase [Protaetiibacter intestinalis]